MKKFIPLLLGCLTCLCHAEKWSIYWIAAKGGFKTTIELNPKPLGDYLTSIPSGHSEADQDIKNGHIPHETKIRLLGTFKNHQIFTLEHDVTGSYYSKYHIILAEVEPDKYMPLYIHQYNHGHEKPVALTFVDQHSNFTVSSSIQVIGQGVGSTKDHYSVTYDLKEAPILKHTTTY
jgi:hypothetical protein